PRARAGGGVLRVAGGVALAVVGGADVHADRPGRVDQRPRVFPATVGKARRGVVPARAKPGEFGVGGQPDAPVAALAEELGLLLAQLLITGQVQGRIQVALVVAAVVGEQAGRLVGKRVLGDEV